MSCAIPPGSFPPWRGKYVPHAADNVGLARGQIEEAIGLLEKMAAPVCRRAAEALVRARDFLDAALVTSAARVPLALLTPITDDELGQ